jgi:hypothetical protein
VGTFDFQPLHFHADAVTHGFRKKASDSFFFVFDSFKKIDGKLYVALNNFTGQQNALALVHDDLETFEVIGHYNEPQSAALSESAVNRLPDGTWMAICRNDKGNYHFTTSKDGKTWTIGEPKPFVPNGLNSKPTFEKFGGIYYLGWQEATSIQGANRSVFNVDISRDGRTWERKYRFETPQSFQYPAFHEHEGAIWLCVTQGDTDPSRKERIMFGKLENVGQFETQEGRKRIAWPAPPPPPAKAARKAADFKFTPEHEAAVNRQRRIFFQYDPYADIQTKGGFGSDMEALMGYVFDFADMPGSQLDAICIDVSNEGVAHYRSKILRPIQHPGLMKWREQGLDYFDALIRHGHQRGKEIWWGLRINEVERGDLAAYEPGRYGEFKERNPVKAAHPDWLIRSWWWQGFYNYAVKEARDYRLSIIREVAEQYDFDGVHLDFLRHTPFLPPGKQWENREHLTTFMRDVREMLQAQAAKRNRPFLLAARVPDSVEGCHSDGIDLEAWAAQGLVDVLIIGTRTINVDVASFRKAVAGAPVKLLPSFDCYHATDGYFGDQSLDLLCGVFGNYLHQGADAVGIFNNPAGSPEHAARIGLTQQANYDPEILTTIGSLKTIASKPRYYATERRGGYAHNEGYGSSNSHAPLPVTLRYDGTPSTLTLPVWEPVKPGTTATLRLIVFDHVEGDEVTAQLNGTTLKRDLVDAQWKDARIFSPLPQPETVTPGNIAKNLAAQKITRVEFKVPVESLKRGPNSLTIAVNRTGPFPASKPVKVEKVELHLR